MNDGFYFYIVKCSDDSYYIGHAEDLQQRLNDHNSGTYGGYTSKKVPVHLVYSELFQTRAEAIHAEHKVKRWTRRKKEILIKNGWAGFLKK